MDGMTTFGLEVLGSLALSILVLAKLQGRLQRVGAEVCGRPAGAEFWVSYTQLMMFIAPLMLIAFFSRAGNPALAGSVEQLKSSLLLLMAGQFAGLVLMGRAVWKSIPRNSTPSVAALASKEGAAS
jgi:hypothetical protein